MGATRKADGSAGAPAVYTYVRTPGVPPVSVFRFEDVDLVTAAGAHAHDFPALAFFERAGGVLDAGQHRWRIEAGDVFVVPPGLVMGADEVEGLLAAGAWGVAFTPEALGPRAPASLLSWHGHPLLSPFVQGRASTALRLNVPERDRRSWVDRLTALEHELAHRRPGHHEAVVAHLTVLLVDVARLATDVSAGLRLNDEPLLADVFDVIEQRFRGPLSLRDVAEAVNLTPGYVTTVVRRRTGRTVLEWIAERRMAEARRMLVESDDSVEEVARRLGYRDAGYFTRSFRRIHGVTPRDWRRAGRPAAR